MSAIIGLPALAIKPLGFADASSGAIKHARDGMVCDLAVREPM
jgi:hypothetical protein